jgi:hypothetical protein
VKQFPTFWVVWNPGGRNPSVRHLDEMAARNEATRLARENPGTEFFVLEANGSARKTDVEWTPASNSIPF